MIVMCYNHRSTALGFVLIICTSSENTSSTKIITLRSLGTCGSTKDQNEFEIVRESIKRNLEVLCSHKSDSFPGSVFCLSSCFFLQKFERLDF